MNLYVEVDLYSPACDRKFQCKGQGERVLYVGLHHDFISRVCNPNVSVDEWRYDVRAVVTLVD